MRRFALPLSLIACVLAASCSSSAPDYSKAPAQTGGPEQGEWRDTNGTMLALNSGNFTYRKPDGSSVDGTYKVASGQITLSSTGAPAVIAQFPSQSGPVVIDGATLVKTD